MHAQADISRPDSICQIALHRRIGDSLRTPVRSSKMTVSDEKRRISVRTINTEPQPMTLSIPSELEQHINRFVLGGEYPNAEAVLMDAVKALDVLFEFGRYGQCHRLRLRVYGP